MQTATSETKSKSLDLSICVHHYTLRAPCPKGQGTRICKVPGFGPTARRATFFDIFTLAARRLRGRAPVGGGGTGARLHHPAPGAPRPRCREWPHRAVVRHGVGGRRRRSTRAPPHHRPALAERSDTEATQINSAPTRPGVHSSPRRARHTTGDAAPAAARSVHGGRPSTTKQH